MVRLLLLRCINQQPGGPQGCNPLLLRQRGPPRVPQQQRPSLLQRIPRLQQTASSSNSSSSSRMKCNSGLYRCFVGTWMLPLAGGAAVSPHHQQQSDCLPQQQEQQQQMDFVSLSLGDSWTIAETECFSLELQTSFPLSDGKP